MKKSKNVKSMGDVSTSGMTTPGKGHVKPTIKREGVYRGVDRDATTYWKGKIKK